MLIMTQDQFLAQVAYDLEDRSMPDVQTDNCGQMVIYTGYFKWHDGTIRDEEDPDMQDDLTDA